MSWSPCHFSGSGIRHLERKCQPLGPDGQLVRLRPEQVAPDADEVADIEELEHLEVAVAERVLADIGLDAAAAVGQREEVRLSEAADRHDAARRHGVHAR